MSNELTTALQERNRILVALDVEAAKAFIARYGGTVPQRPIDWVRVLHLARFECRTPEIPRDLVIDSQIYLAQAGAQSVSSLPPSSPYLRAAMDLIFPRSIFEAQVEASR